MYKVRQRQEWLEYIKTWAETHAAASYRYCIADAALYAGRANDDGRYWDSLAADMALRGELCDFQFECGHSGT